MTYVLGLDLGTSSLKGVLVNRQGRVVRTASANYPLVSASPGFSEQDPADWVEAAQKVMKELLLLQPDLLEKLAGISFSGQMHSLVVLDKQKQVLRNAILWNDVRTTKQCERIMSEAGDLVLAVTKNKALEGFTLPKILWLQEHEPELWQKVCHIMLPKDYLGFWLTGQIHMDYSDAAGTLLFDVENKTWSQAISDRFAISGALLPKLVQSSQQIGTMLPALQAYFGFKKEIKIFAGGADNACAAIAAGITEAGVGMCSIGTSGVFLAFEADLERNYQGDIHLFNHGMADVGYAMGVTLAAGHSLSWFKETFAKELSYDELLADLGETLPGADGLLFAPYLVGERTPYSDSKIRASFIGLDTHHTRKHLVRAVLEGITFSLKDSQVLMATIAKKEVTQIVSVGGGAKNKEWLQMQADIFNAPVVKLATEEGPGLGAAMLAAVGLGWYDTIQSCSQDFVSYSARYEPLPERVVKYQQIYEIYRDIYGATKEINHRLQALR